MASGSSAGESAGLLLDGFKASCGFGGGWVAGSGSVHPRRCWPSTASEDLGAGGVGARPQSMGVRLRPFLLRLQPKPECDGASSVHGGARFRLRWRCPAAASSSAVGSRRIQGFLCNFFVVQGPLRSTVATAFLVSSTYVSVFVRVPVCSPFLRNTEAYFQKKKHKNELK